MDPVKPIVDIVDNRILLVRDGSPSVAPMIDFMNIAADLICDYPRETLRMGAFAAIAGLCLYFARR